MPPNSWANMKNIIIAAIFLAGLSACASRPPTPTYTAFSPNAESEYAPYLLKGTAEISGQGFLAQKGGGTVKAAGREVILDPVTEVSTKWWYQAGKVWAYRNSTPPSVNFRAARRTTIADADGRFKFADLSAGSYYIRTEVTWDVPFHGIQGGLVTGTVTVKDGESKQTILNSSN